MARRRPNPIQWIGYACGRRLPDSMSEWVRNDLTGKYATPRHLVRGMVPLTPIFAAFLLFPGELWLRGAMILLAVLLGLFYCTAYMPMNRAHRLVKHGFPPDLQNSEQLAKQAADRAAYEAKYPRS